jgi:hypothetical protein
MSTLPLRASSVPQIRPIPGLARLGTFLMLIVDTFADAQKSMREAQKKYPYAGI